MPKYRIYFMKPEFYPIYITGLVLPEPSRIAETHTYLTDWSVTTDWRSPVFALRRILHYFQAENWSPNGEARELIIAKELGHISMNVGDVIEDEAGVFWVVRNFGFAELTDH